MSEAAALLAEGTSYLNPKESGVFLGTFEKVPGVIEVISGYSGGKAENASYKKVSRGITNHIESASKKLLFIYFD